MIGDRGTTSPAVMQQRAPKIVREDTPEERLWRNLDFFPTPPWAARAMAHRIRWHDPGAETAFDPCCGQGHMAEPMREYFGEKNVIASDVYDYGYGEVRDFLAGGRLPTADWVMMNPPFKPAHDFILRAFEAATRGVMVLARIAFLETEGREQMLYEGENKLTCIMPFVERVPMQLGSWDPNLSTATCYAAFVFFKGRQPQPHAPFLSGAKMFFSRPDDAARFAHPAPIPLFEKLAAPALFQPTERIPT